MARTEHDVTSNQRLVQAASSDVSAMAALCRTELRLMLEDRFALYPAMVLPSFFFIINYAVLTPTVEEYGIADALIFFLPVGLLFASSNGGSGMRVVGYIESGYFDKLVVTRSHPRSLLLGWIAAEGIRTVGLSCCVLMIGALVGAPEVLRPDRLLPAIAISGLWGLSYAGFGFAIALRSGSFQVTGLAYLIFFPFAFFTTALLPQDALVGWFASIVALNPVTYVLDAQREVLAGEPSLRGLLSALGASAILALATWSMALLALRWRLNHD